MNKRDLKRLLVRAERAHYGDSNDREIDLLREALDETLARIGMTMPTLSEREIERLES